MQTLQEIQNAFGIFMEEQEYEKSAGAGKLTEKNTTGSVAAGTERRRTGCYGDIDFKSGTFIEDHLVDSEVESGADCRCCWNVEKLFFRLFQRNAQAIRSTVISERTDCAGLPSAAGKIRRFRQNRWRMLSGIMMKNIL